MPQHLSEEQIARYRGRRTPPAELPEIDDHISQCADCRERLASAGDLRTALQRERVAGSGSAFPEAQVRGEHLAYEQLEAYVDGKSSRREREVVREHVQLCRACTDELRDLDAFKTELAGSAGVRTWNLRAWWTALALATSAAIILVVSQENLRLASPPLATSSQNARPAPTGESLSAELAASVVSIHAFDTLTSEEQHAVIEAVAQQKINSPNVLSELQLKQQTLLGESPKGPRFEVLAPLGEVVLDVRPVFRWQPVTGASGYSVAIFDAELNPVQSSAPLHGTQWTPDRALKRGQLYEWQVIAKLGGGKSVSAPNPPSPEAKFRVLDQKRADEIVRFLEANPQAHIVLAILYAQAGLLEPGEHELEQVAKDDPNYGLAQNLLKSIREMRNPRR